MLPRTAYGRFQLACGLVAALDIATGLWIADERFIAYVATGSGVALALGLVLDLLARP